MMDRLALIWSPRWVVLVAMLGLTAMAWHMLWRADVAPAPFETDSVRADTAMAPPRLLPDALEASCQIPQLTAGAWAPAAVSSPELSDGPLIVPPDTATIDPLPNVPRQFPAIHAPATPVASAEISPVEPAANRSPPRQSIAEAVADEEPLPTGSASPLLTPFEPMHRSRRLEEIAREADLHTRQGFELAGRGAYHSARAEFVQALRLVAQGLDQQHGTQIHGQSLSAGLVAVEEAEDFVPRGSCLEADLDLESILAGHRTPVLADTPSDELSPITAVQRYLSYSQEQLALAVGGEVAGSMALHALGKLHAALASRSGADARLAKPTAVTFYQAALIACRQNHMAANDLGVLLARAGRHVDAAVAFEHSLSVQPNATVWSNLATVYRQLGDHDLAARADTLAQNTLDEGQSQPNAWAARTQWVPPGAFADSYAQLPDTLRPPPAARAASTDLTPSSGMRQAQRAWPWNLLGNTRK